MAFRAIMARKAIECTGSASLIQGEIKEMYAIIECGGKQYRVSEGDVVRVEKLDAAVGSTIDIEKVLMLGGETIQVGSPLVEDALVSCKVLNHDKDKKVLVFHYKAKKNIRKRYGHRQPFTSLLVESISYGKGSKPEKKVAPKAVETETAVAVDTLPVTEAAEKPAKKTAKKTEAAEPAADKPVKKTAAKKSETAATAEDKPAKKTTTRAKKTEE
jgi:large subunit ribosomal protein L21